VKIFDVYIVWLPDWTGNYRKLVGYPKTELLKLVE